MIAVFGGDGLIGSNIDFQDIKFNRESCDLHDFDKLLNCLTKNNIEVVINCAAYQKNYQTMSQNQADHFHKNTSINMNVFKASQLSGVKKIVSLSSINAIQRVDIRTESDLWLHEPRDYSYAESHKNRILHILSKLYKEQYDIECITPMLSNTYGPNINKTSNGAVPILINKCIEAIKNKHDLVLSGDGKASRDFIYVKDVNRAIKLMINKISSYEPIILSSGICSTVKDILEIIIDTSNYKGKVTWDKSNNKEDIKICSNDLFKSYFPDFKFTSIEKGVSETVKYFMRKWNV